MFLDFGRVCVCFLTNGSFPIKISLWFSTCKYRNKVTRVHEKLTERSFDEKLIKRAYEKVKIQELISTYMANYCFKNS